MIHRSTFLLSLAAFAGIPAVTRAASASAADLIVTGATIHSVDDAYSKPQAFAVRGGRFVHVGTLAGALALRGPHTEVLDLSGKTVLPGLIDAHLHLTLLGLNLHEVDLFGARSPAEVVVRTVAFAGSSPDDWILGDGWDQNLWPVQAFPTHDALSAALPDRPVVLDRVDGHALLANAKAMQLAGVSRATVDPPGGRIVRDAAGDPTGVFIDGAMSLINTKIPPPTHDRRVRAIRAAIAECNRWGLTAVAEPGVDDATLAAHEDVLRAGAYTIRNAAMVYGRPDLLASYLPKGPTVGSYGDRLWVHAVKLYADGALGSRGAALLAPYSDDPGNTGLLNITAARIQTVSERALRAGFQTCVHAIGDRANRIVLDAYQAALQNVPVKDHRLRIEHAQLLSSSDIPRFAQLGVIPSMQTTHQISDMAWVQERLGTQRLRGAYAWRSLLDTGVIIPNGTDAPVEVVNPIRTFHAAISRQNERNQPPEGWYADQRMTREEALKSMTIWAARGNFQEQAIGSITPGKRADFVVMDRDWMTIPPEDVMSTRILSTYLDGRAVFDASSLPIGSMPAFAGRRYRNACCS